MRLHSWTRSALRHLPLVRRRADPPVTEAEAEALLRVADRLRDRQEYRTAAIAYGEVLQFLPARTDLWVQYGNMLKDSGQFAEAEEAYHQALIRAPDEADIHLQLGHARKLRGDLDAASRAYARAAVLSLSNTDAGDELALPEAASEVPAACAPISDPEAAIAEADRLRDAGRALPAAQAYRRALALAPDRSDLLVQLGNMLKDAGRYHDAMATYTLASEARPDDADVWLQYGRACQLAGQVEQALAAFRTALRLAPSLHDAAGELDRILPLDQGQPGELRSKIENCGPGEVSGWVFEAARPEQPADVSIALDGTLYLTLRAERTRRDLTRVAPNIAGGGFAFRLPPGEGSVEVSVTVRGQHLRGSPFEVALERRPVSIAPRYAPARGIARREDQDRETSTGVAIVIPVFNAPEETARCLAAVVAFTTMPAQLIILDDASTDEAVPALLDAYRGKPAVIVARNEKNLGYTRTVNRGIALAGRSDVVILNSDTAVGPRWLEQLQCAALSAQDIASVTALSDNAGAFTLPDADRPTTLPAGFAMEDLQRLTAQVAARHWPSVPTGNGFCMYLRRTALDAVGLFDEEAFPRGYGEENDWSMRAVRRGWRHLIEDRTLVHHERSASFGSARVALVKEGRKVLDERYPEYGTLVQDMRMNAGLADARRRMRVALARPPQRPRPRVLFVISTQTGGTPLTNRDLMACLSDEYEPLLLMCDARVITLTRPAMSREEADVVLARHVLSEPLTIASHASAEYDATLMRWLSDFSVEFLHIRHLAWHSLNLPAIAQSLGIPVVLSFHDFYAACPALKLLDGAGTYCGGHCTSHDGDCTPELWDAATAPPLKGRYIHQWRSQFRRVHDSCDAFVTTSDSARATLLDVYPELGDRRFVVIPHGRDFDAFLPPRPTPAGLAKLSILVPGNISPAKGRDLIAALADIDRGERLHFHLLGDVSSPLEGPRIQQHGRYARDDFPELASRLKADIGAVFSIWPETYCHTLTELWAIGLPAVGFDLGAVGERIRATGAGWLMPHRSPEELYAALTGIADDVRERQRAADRVAAWQAGEGRVSTRSNMASRYRALYAGLLAERRVFSQ